MLSHKNTNWSTAYPILPFQNLLKFGLHSIFIVFVKTSSKSFGIFLTISTFHSLINFYILTMKKQIFILSYLWVATTLWAQQAPTPASEVQKALEQKAKMQETSLVKNVPFTNIGPTVMSGRVVDVDVNPNNPTEFYVAYASGGLWYSNNNGVSFTPVMDNSSTQNLGDIAVDWKNGTIWAGTGENNASRSSYAGIGILKSTDKGQTWQHMGLPDSHHIGRF